MNNYIDIIKISLAFFPFITLIISIPFILIEYHKFGSISFLKSLVIYSFIFYFICAYFLVVLPLPTFEKVVHLTTPRIQLIPFKFVFDFITHTSFNIFNISTYLKGLKESYFYVPIYNLFLTFPFGIYLRYYFKTNLKKTILYTFLLSLFFELTQLSGLYFIYPRSYRLFDIDDLLLNTIGGTIGYLVFPIVMKFFPKREELERKALIKGEKISGFKRFTAVMLDFFIFMFIDSILSFVFKKWDFAIISYVVVFIYYVLLPFILGGSTLAEKYLNLKIVDKNNKNNILKLFFRKLFFIISYIIIPIFLIIISINLAGILQDNKLKTIIVITYILIVMLIYSLTGIKYVFTNKKMIYEKLSGTRMISTIKEKKLIKTRRKYEE